MYRARALSRGGRRFEGSHAAASEARHHVQHQSSVARARCSSHSPACWARRTARPRPSLDAGAPTDIKLEIVPSLDVVEIGVCLEDIDYEDIDIEGFDPDLDVEAYCLARRKGYKVHFLASQDTLEIGDEDTEDECRDTAKVFCKDVFGRRLKDSCLGLPLDDL